MEEILVAVLQFLFELFINIFSNVSFDSTFSNQSKSEPASSWDSYFWWFIGACCLGWLSLLVFKYTLIHSFSLRCTNIIFAPLISAQLSQALAVQRAKSDPLIVPQQHYWRAFWFALGFALVRFAYATHF